MPAKKILITGVSGLVGSAAYLYLSQWPERYELYGLGRRRALSERIVDQRKIDLPAERFFVCDVADMDGVHKAVAGMDAVVHMAADPAGRSWESLRDNNLIGAYNIFEACHRAGVERLIAASTIQVSTGDAADEPYKTLIEKDQSPAADFPTLTAGTPGQPRNLYAASKVWSESLARVYAHDHNMSCLCIRIGWVTGEDESRNGRGDIWCSQRDIAELIKCCIDADDEVRFDIFYGMSDNKRRWVDIENARQRVGYVSRDRAED
jgi:NAD+ dependent glucose-6-phosphate dehydrogenase